MDRSAHSPRSVRNVQTRLLRCGELVQILDIGHCRAIDPLDFRITGLNHIVLIGSVSAAAVSQTEVASRQAKRFAGEHISWPGTRQPRHHYGVDSGPAIDCGPRT